MFAHPDRPSATGVSTWANLRHTGYGPDPWRPRKSGPQPQTGAAWTGEGANVGSGWPAAVEVKPAGGGGGGGGGGHERGAWVWG